MTQQLEAILKKCDATCSEINKAWRADGAIGHTDVFQAGAIYILAKHQPIIRELCEVIEEQQKALNWTLDPCECDAMWSGRDDKEWLARGAPSCTCPPYWNKVKIALDSTTKRLAKLSDPDHNSETRGMG